MRNESSTRTVLELVRAKLKSLVFSIFFKRPHDCPRGNEKSFRGVAVIVENYNFATFSTPLITFHNLNAGIVCIVEERLSVKIGKARKYRLFFISKPSTREVPKKH